MQSLQANPKRIEDWHRAWNPDMDVALVTDKVIRDGYNRIIGETSGHRVCKSGRHTKRCVAAEALREKSLARPHTSRGKRAQTVRAAWVVPRTAQRERDRGTFPSIQYVSRDEFYTVSFDRLRQLRTSTRQLNCMQQFVSMNS